MQTRPTPTRRRIILAVAALSGAALMAASGCDSSDPGEDVSIEGIWTGESTVDGTVIPFRLVLTETPLPVGGTTVRGTGTVTLSGQAVPFTIAGSYIHPLIDLEFTFSDRPTGGLAGQVNDKRDRITATVSGPGIGGSLELRPE